MSVSSHFLNDINDLFLSVIPPYPKHEQVRESDLSCSMGICLIFKDALRNELILLFTGKEFN